MDLAALKQMFFGECDDYLSQANETLGALAEGADPAEPLNALFRSVHSIKGGARAFGIDQLAEFAHGFETYMDSLRKGERALDEGTFDRLALGFDLLDHLVAAARGEGQPARAEAEAFLSELQGQATAAAPPAADLPEGEGESGAAAGLSRDGDGGFDPGGEAEDEPGGGGVMRRYRLTIEPAEGMFEAGGEPLLLLRNLAQLGLLTTEVDTSRLPPLAELDLNMPYFRWTVLLESECERREIVDLLEFVDDVAHIELTSLDPEPVEADDDDQDAAAAAPPLPAAEPVAPPAAGPPTLTLTGVEVDLAPAVAPAPAPLVPPAPPARESVRTPTVRVEVPKLERLGNMVGELVIAQAVLQQQAGDIREAEKPGLFRAIKDMSQHIRDLQDIALALRAQPLKATFARLIPVTRELERATGKKIRLTLAGDEIEIDKTVVDRLAEPLTHLLRNAVDHGIETREQRLAAGKPAEGQVRLSAHQQGSQVFITLQDDGRGLNRAAVRAKALQRGLIAADVDLSEQEIDNLIFLPGFSTAAQVTEVSGRGVGLDVVRQTILEFGGQIVVESDPGAGCRFTLVLPLSLAIIDVLVAEVGRQRYLLPIGNIVESVRPIPRQLVTIPERGRFLHLRGSMLPIISLAAEFAVPEAVGDPVDGILVIAELRRGLVAALLVDDVLDQEPVVIKSLERNYRKVPGVAAATILGDGRAALIVDYRGLERALSSDSRRPRPPARRAEP